MKIKLTIEYDGTKFYGWQRQQSSFSVQEAIETAIMKIFNGYEKITLFGAGRTDTGVHATEQVAHFEILTPKLIENWKFNINKLPIAINFYLQNSGTFVTKAEIVDDHFHARFSAKQRHYRYIIFNRYIDSAINKNRVWHVPRKLDENKMNKAAKFFIGTHDLNAFRSAHCNAKNAIRTIDDAKVYRIDDFIYFEISAKSFLHNQVRITMGTLKQIGEEKFEPQLVQKLLEGKDRTKSGETAPPFGLYLTKVDY